MTERYEEKEREKSILKIIVFGFGNSPKIYAIIKIRHENLMNEQKKKEQMS